MSRQFTQRINPALGRMFSELSHIVIIVALAASAIDVHEPRGTHERRARQPPRISPSIQAPSQRCEQHQLEVAGYIRRKVVQDLFDGVLRFRYQGRIRQRRVLRHELLKALSGARRTPGGRLLSAHDRHCPYACPRPATRSCFAVTRHVAGQARYTDDAGLAVPLEADPAEVATCTSEVSALPPVHEWRVIHTAVRAAPRPRLGPCRCGCSYQSPPTPPPRFPPLD